jgi:hypothetical protein
MRYEFLDLPCLGHTHVCTHAQFVKEFKPIFPEIKYEIPKEVSQQFGDASLASEQCILIIIDPINNVKEAAWLCHPDLKTVLDLQVAISKAIFDANKKEYDFVTEYVQEKKSMTKGVMNIYKDKFVFNDMDKKLVLTAEWKDVEPYATSLYLKEDLEWKGSKEDKPDPQRCFKIYRKSELSTNNADYFCANYQRNDVTRRLLLNQHQGRYAAEMYTNKINIRLHAV